MGAAAGAGCTHGDIACMGNAGCTDGSRTGWCAAGDTRREDSAESDRAAAEPAETVGSANGHEPAPEKDAPALRVEIGGVEPASKAARNGDTTGAAGEELDAAVVEVVEAEVIDVAAEVAAAAESEAAEAIVRSDRCVRLIPCEMYVLGNAPHAIGLV
jgi:hypothetical protein